MKDETSYTQGAGSRVAIAGHPLHPMLVPLPVGALIGALCTDIAFAITGDVFWARGSVWLLGAGFVTGVLAALGGLLEAALITRARKLKMTWAHAIGNMVALGVAGANMIVRLDDPAEAIVVRGLVTSAITVMILAFTAWLGGEMSFRHGIGVSKKLARKTGLPTRPDPAAGPTVPFVTIP